MKKVTCIAEIKTAKEYNLDGTTVGRIAASIASDIALIAICSMNIENESIAEQLQHCAASLCGVFGEIDEKLPDQIIRESKGIGESILMQAIGEGVAN